MSTMALLIACALAFGLTGMAVLLWAIGSGQYDDMDGAAHRILLEDPEDGCGPRADG